MGRDPVQPLREGGGERVVCQSRGRRGREGGREGGRKEREGGGREGGRGIHTHSVAVQ